MGAPTGALGRVRAALGLQAAVGAVACWLPGLGTTAGWAAVQAGLAGGAALLTWYAGRRPDRAAPAVLAFELVALAAGAVGLGGRHYLPGSVLGVRVLAGMLGSRDEPVAGPAQDAAALVEPPPAAVVTGFDILPAQPGHRAAARRATAR